jgi:dUTP pyrophosphatase
LNNLKVKKINDYAVVPRGVNLYAACADICCCEDTVVEQGKLTMVSTGLVFEIPVGYMVEIRPRSGIATKGIVIPNSPCTIDSDYRGEVRIPMFGLFGSMKFSIGSRVAQFRMVKLDDYYIVEVNEVSDTIRGTGGFGSTGI